jgi:hypothetical protein
LQGLKLGQGLPKARAVEGAMQRCIVRTQYVPEIAEAKFGFGLRRFDALMAADLQDRCTATPLARISHSNIQL